MMTHEVKLGELAKASDERDAIHIAVAPVVAACDLSPGEHVGVLPDGRASGAAKHIGIVDPFLMKGPRSGEWFYLCLFPYTITSLRHEWSHPSFAGWVDSEKWLREYVKRHCPYWHGDEGYDEFLSRARAGELFYYGSDLHGSYELEESDELMRHLSVLLGRSVNQADFTYSCSC